MEKEIKELLERLVDATESIASTLEDIQISLDVISTSDIYKSKKDTV